MCEAILAYKSKDGKIYATKRECDTATKAYEDNLLKEKIKEVFSHVIRAPRSSHAHLSDPYNFYYEAQSELYLRECVTNWGFIRDKLNEIET